MVLEHVLAAMSMAAYFLSSKAVVSFAKIKKGACQLLDTKAL